ncbi:class I SAM-dependent methyltransferase [Acidisphaera sp. L21]|uniref:class I SAM-dependent methyltransferase n=1 Tax=Acidisphaera sp. L21 TaxID=1641851 RepID=UPI00131C0750|nr:methyltransferase domain-containing protein [Acidisphaera sp. L21]
MAEELPDAAAFYATAQGEVALGLVREKLTQIWPDLSGQIVLGLGHAAPYLRAWREGSARCLSATPGGASAWPGVGPSLSCAVQAHSLPFSDLSLDRVLLVHGLENAERARPMLREIWRVLKDDGALLVVTPNRNGLWAHAESTPFGHGQPYSAGQVGRLLTSSLFRVERRDGVLYVPPSRHRLVLRSARLFERAGRNLVPHLAGLTITEAVKDVYAALPLAPARRRFVVQEAA